MDQTKRLGVVATQDSCRGITPLPMRESVKSSPPGESAVSFECVEKIRRACSDESAGLDLVRTDVGGFLTCLTWTLCSARESEYMRMSSRYAVQNTSRKSRRVLLIKCWKEAGAFVNPKGMTLYSKWP